MSEFPDVEEIDTDYLSGDRSTKTGWPSQTFVRQSFLWRPPGDHEKEIQEAHEREEKN